MPVRSKFRGAFRKSFGKVRDIVSVPDLIAVQSHSFNEFVQLDYLPDERKPVGIEKVFRDIFPIEYDNKMSLGFTGYELGNWSCTCGKLVGISNRYTWKCTSCDSAGCSRVSPGQKCAKCKKGGLKYKICSNCLSRVNISFPFSVEECRINGQTFSMPLKVGVQLVSWGVDEEGNKIIRDVKAQEIFFTEIPVMLDLYEKDGRISLGNLGTFLINGIDRVIVSQLHRSPGVIFSHSKKFKDVHGKPYYLARIIPMRGAWITFEFDGNDLLSVRVDKRRKVLVTTFLQAFGIPRRDILSLFYDFEQLFYKDGRFYQELSESLLGRVIESDKLDIRAKKAEKFVGKRFTKEILSGLKSLGSNLYALNEAVVLERVVAEDILDPETGEVLVEFSGVITDKILAKLKKYKDLKFKVIAQQGYSFEPTVALTLRQDKAYSQEEALREVHSKVWPGDRASIDDAREYLENMFFNPRFYDLTRVGRIKMNRKLGLDFPEDKGVLSLEDLLAALRYLVNLRERGEGEVDDIDHLGSRRVRLVGELLVDQLYIGLLRIERIVRERFRVQDLQQATFMPQEFFNVRPLGAIFHEFFNTGQLSQFMDQTNPLSEVAHKRRLSALGPGGIAKDRATYEVRDVHTSHYGRICPIETPEGQTIGLITSLATYAFVNDLGFIETAYRPVVKGKVQDKVVFLDAFEEWGYRIAQAREVGSGERLKSGQIVVRHSGNFQYVESDNVDFVDLSPKQLVSVATALIPFLEHDDASRALMGANMQRQAVPLLRTQVPVVGTGMEEEIVNASGACLVAKKDGVVEYVSSDRIVVRYLQEGFVDVEDWVSGGIDIYQLKKFQRSSFGTWIHQTPIVECGQLVREGEVVSNASAINDGELALGANLLVAFIPWYGYNFEDAVVLNKRLVSEDVLTSVHIDEFSVEARDTKLGPEEITRDIPNVSEKALSGLDEDGIIKIGARVSPGDIIVGKVTLKGDVQHSAEEKLLRAIFGEKSRDVRDTSLRVPPGVEGTVVDVKVFSRSGARRDKRYKSAVVEESENLDFNFGLQKESLENMLKERLVALLADKRPNSKDFSKLLSGKVFSKSKLSKLKFEELLDLKAKEPSVNKEVGRIKELFGNQLRILLGLKDEFIAKLRRGDPLPSGVIKLVKVFIAMKRTIQVGDKLAGRHGNKGVVSIIVPREDMPFLDDGTPVDIVCNPLGVPSRMNIGQILETILGFAGKQVGKRFSEAVEKLAYKEVRRLVVKYFGAEFAKKYEKDFGEDGLMRLARRFAESGLHFKVPVFDSGTFEGDIQPLLRDVGLPEFGSFKLRDGRTGEYLDQPATVGLIYMMKLNHMVDDKIHARSIGPYSLITQQPLGGKSQMGGQRFGEMEVWALEAYGAAHVLQEMLTYKSDDVVGRHKVHEAIIRNEEIPEPGIPESFNVLVKELQSLCIGVDLFKTSKEDVGE